MVTAASARVTPGPAGEVTQSSNSGLIVALIIGGALLYQCQQKHAAAALDNEIADRTAEIQSGNYTDAYGDLGCTSDCSGHEAGFAWAREHDIASEEDCSSHGDSDGSFAAGCKAYVHADREAEDQVRDEKEYGN